MIDWSRVEELLEEIGAEDFGEVVEMFLDEVETVIVQLENDPDNFSNAEEQMHFLKGAALNLGFLSLAQLCQKGETSAASGHPGTVSAAEVRTILELSRSRFEKDLPDRLAA